ncbi:MAG: hypothetical protein JWQ20_4494 [Conexibacter sp.]|nr:hypothetical protein [Conexibacter sp.]
MESVAKDGTDQVFGLGAVAPGAAVKQGWADGSADEPENALVNTASGTWLISATPSCS